MKPIFAIDITLDKNNDSVNGSEFITNTVSSQKSTELESNQEELQESFDASRFPFWLRLVHFVCGILALIVAAGVFRNLPVVSFSQMIKNAPVLIISGAACGVAWVVLQILSKKKEKKVLKERNVEQQMKEIDDDLKEIYSELGLPQDAINVDVLLFKYKIKDGKVRPQTIGIQSAPYICMEMRAYADGKRLHLSDAKNLYSFDLSRFKYINTVNKRISIANWNKNQEPKKGEYKQYKMTVDNTGFIWFKPYYILEGECNGEAFGIYFPCYELPAFERLTGLKAKIED